MCTQIIFIIISYYYNFIIMKLAVQLQIISTNFKLF